MAHEDRTLAVAFLRAVNVGGRTVKMQALRDAFEALGLSRVETVLASGNVLFECTSRDWPGLQPRIAAQLARAWPFEIEVFIRWSAELAALVARAPFEPSDIARAGTHVVGFLGAPPAPEAQRRIESWNTASDRFQCLGRELHWMSRDTQSQSKHSAATFERALGQPITLRGWGTLLRLNARCGIRV